jgi:endonuclease/exonuclease/phosphatase family metal-dependent hydrolase
MPLRIATFNLENLDDRPGMKPTLQERAAIMRPQLQRVRADILCLQEVHSQGPSGARTLAALDALVSGTDYAGFHRATTVTTDGQPYDQRNLVVLSRHPITAVAVLRDSDGPRPRYQFVTADPPDTTAGALTWERPILHCRVEPPGLPPIEVVNLHLKSKLATTVAGQKLDWMRWRSPAAWAEGSFVSTMKRVGQALQVRMHVDALFDAHGDLALIAVCGDFNADAQEVTMRAICGPVEETGNPAHAPRVLVPCENNIPESARYSLLHLGRGVMLDHVIVSRGLLRWFDHAEIHNEALPDESGAFRTDRNFPESDHAPVIAEFALG